MSVYSLFIINESGSLQFYHDHCIPIAEVERVFHYPLPFCFITEGGRVAVNFGATDEIKLGYVVLSVNNYPVKGLCMEDGQNVLQYFADEGNFPMSVKFGRPSLQVNDQIQLASMFQPLHRMARFLSPVPDANSVGSGSSGAGNRTGRPAPTGVISSLGGTAGGEPEQQTMKRSGPAQAAPAPTSVVNSGIQTLETLACRIHCLESHTGVKFVLVTDAKVPSLARESLRRVYEAYTDYVLKNPLYNPTQRLKFEFFTNQVKLICEQIERGIYTVG